MRSWTEAILSRSFRWSWWLLLVDTCCMFLFEFLTRLRFDDIWIFWIDITPSYQYCDMLCNTVKCIIPFFGLGPNPKQPVTRIANASQSPRVELVLELANHSKRFSDEAEYWSEARGIWDRAWYFLGGKTDTPHDQPSAISVLSGSKNENRWAHHFFDHFGLFWGAQFLVRANL